MSIFYKFGVEAGDASNVECGAMEMSLAELKIKVIFEKVPSIPLVSYPTRLW